MSRWSVAGIAFGALMYLAAIFAGTYSLIAWAWDRRRS